MMIKVNVPYKHRALIRAAVPAVRWFAQQKVWYVKTKEDADAVERVVASLYGIAAKPIIDNPQVSANFDKEQMVSVVMLEQLMAGSGFAKVAASGNYRVFVKKPESGEITRDQVVIAYMVKPSHFELLTAEKPTHVFCKEDLINYTNQILAEPPEEPNQF